MRSLRTSLILAALAILLLGFILWFERGTLTTGELEKRKSSAIPELVRERVSKLEIQRAGTITVVRRQAHDDDGDEPETWRVEAPYRANADQDAIDTLLGELEFLDARRRFENISADDRKRFGFEQPRYRLWFTVGDRRESILVGNESPRGDGVYVQAADPKLAFVASKDLLKTLAQEPAHYHTKELHAGATISGALELSLRDAQGERAVRKQADGSWALVRPALGLASEPAIAELIQAFDSLRAKHFIEASAKSLGEYGLDKPRFELSLHASKASAPPAKQSDGNSSELVTRLRVGSACSGYPGESYVTLDGREISCALDEDLAKLGTPLAALREARLLPWADDAIASLQLDRGDRRLQLTKTDAGWSYAALRAGKSVGQGDARPEAVSDWLAALRGAKAERWQAGGLGSVRAADAITLGVARKDKPRYELRLDAGKRPLVAQRGTEPELALFSESLLERLTPSAARFQKLDLIHVDPAAFRQIEIRRQNQVERLVSSDGKSFRIEAPIQTDADAIRATELTRLIGGLEAARFVADEPDSSHALTTPQVVLGAEYEDDPKSPRKHIGLRIGAATDGGRFAQLDTQPGVFVIASRLAELLSEPLVSRTALSVPLEAIATIDIEHAGKKLHLERDGEQIVASDASLPPARAQAIAEAIATLRASSVASYGPPTAAQGLQKPYARISITAKEPRQARRIALGNEAQGGRYAQGDDPPVVFVLPAKLTTALLPDIAVAKTGLAAHP